jgi:hypothetical protein
VAAHTLESAVDALVVDGAPALRLLAAPARLRLDVHERERARRIDYRERRPHERADAREMGRAALVVERSHAGSSGAC